VEKGGGMGKERKQREGKESMREEEEKEVIGRRSGRGMGCEGIPALLGPFPL